MPANTRKANMCNKPSNEFNCVSVVLQRKSEFNVKISVTAFKRDPHGTKNS